MFRGATVRGCYALRVRAREARRKFLNREATARRVRESNSDAQKVSFIP